MQPPDRQFDRVELVGEEDPPGSVVTALEDAGFSVTQRSDVAETVASVTDGQTDCVVAHGGLDRYRALRDASETVPVVVVTSATDEELVRTVVADPAAEFVGSDAATATLLPARVRQVVRSDPSERIGWDLADLADEAIVQFDLETYEVLAANESFEDQWGIDGDSLAGVTLEDLRVTDITHELRGQGRGEAGEEELEWITDGGAVETFVQSALDGDYEVREWHCEDADGGWFKSDVQVVADPGSDVGYLAASVPSDHDDVETDYDGETEYDEASMLQSVMEHVPMSVYFEDTLGRHVLVSEDLVEPFIEATDGKIMHTPEDVHGKTYFDMYPESVAEAATADNERIMETGEPLRNQEQVQPPKGRELWFTTNKAPWYDDEGHIKGIVGITVDITDQKRRERELNRQNERLEEFASIVSHDLRNPLNVAQGRLELYHRTGDESELETVAEMHDRIAGLIDEVLAFAREGRHIEDPEWVDGNSQARAAWNAVDTAQATLEQDWAHEVESDSRRLVRMFENLFRNAIEHAGTDVTVEVGTLDDEGGFYVQDDGAGIPADVRDDLFDRGASTNEDGTGYGLAIVREIADAHGWEIGLADVEEGTRFKFTGVATRSSE